MRSGRLCLLVLPLVVVALGCSSWPDESPSPPSGLEIAGRDAKTIVVFPLNIVLALPTELDSSTEMVSDALVEHIKAQGKTVQQLDFRDARALWIRATQIVSESHRAKNFENAAEVLVQLNGKKTEFDALIIPSLFLQHTRLKSPRAGLTAHWDGAIQRVEWVGTPANDTKEPRVHSLEGASILIYVFDREGRQLLEKRTGIELIQHFEIETKKRQGRDLKTWELTDDVPAIGDRARVQAAMAHALSPFLPEESPTTSRLSTTRSAG